MKCHGLLYAKLNDSGQEIERVYAQDCSKVEISGIAKSIKYNIKYKGYYWKRVILDVENYYKRFQDISKEIWSDIIGLESSGWKVSNLGTLKNSKGIIVVGTLNEFGYRFVNIQRKIYKVHRLVAATFITKRPLLETEIIDHIDTNRENNSAANLRVCDGHGENLSNPETRKKHLKPVLQYDLQGNFIKEHASVIEAYLDLGFTLEKASKYSGIISCCRGKYKSSQGYIWRYK